MIRRKKYFFEKVYIIIAFSYSESHKNPDKSIKFWVLMPQRQKFKS